jgi:photosystem II stability/assembly factor-like uncharacterized protein
MFEVGRIDSLRGEWLAGTLMSKFNNKVIYHGLQHLYKSEDGGDNWKMISPDLTYNDRTKMGVYPYLIYHQAICSIAEGNEPGILYTGTDDGRVWLTMDDGANWKEISKGLPVNKHVAKIFASSKKGTSTVYVALNDRRQDNNTPYLYMSEDKGNTWKLISSNLPPAPVNVVMEDPESDNIYCGTDMGIYMSWNRGKSWMAINGNLPASVSVNDMFIHPRDKKLVIATYGRGVWILDDISTLK